MTTIELTKLFKDLPFYTYPYRDTKTKDMTKYNKIKIHAYKKRRPYIFEVLNSNNIKFKTVAFNRDYVWIELEDGE